MNNLTKNDLVDQLHLAMRLNQVDLALERINQAQKGSLQTYQNNSEDSNIVDISGAPIEFDILNSTYEEGTRDLNYVKIQAVIIFPTESS